MQTQELFEYWNSKKIIIHRILNKSMKSEAEKRFKEGYSLKDLKELIDLYHTILEPDKSETQKKYFWSYKWNFYEFLARGVKKFDGQSAENYKKKQKINTPQSIII